MTNLSLESPNNSLLHRREFMNLPLRTIFFLTALAPAALINVFRQIYEDGYKYEHGYWLFAGFLSCALPFLIVSAVKQMGEELPFIAKKVESNDWISITCVTSYLIPIVFKIDGNLQLVSSLLVASVVFASLSSIPTHPLLHFFNYKFYKVEGNGGIVYTLIARRKILDVSDIKVVRAISHQLLLEG